MEQLPGPRDLGPYVAQLLRQLGFQTWEQQPTPSLTLVTGSWTGVTGEQFSFQYAHHHPPHGPVSWAACNLGVRLPGAAMPAVCFANQQVRRLREVRLLLLGNDLFAAARQRRAVAQSSSVHATS